MTQKADVEKRASGKWTAVLHSLAVEERYLTGRHGPCPKCGGRDRYRYTNFADRGNYVCNGCGNGDAFDLLNLVHGWNLDQSINAVSEALGLLGDVKPVKPTRPDPRKALRALMKGCSKDRGPLQGYLHERGLTCCPDALRFNPQTPYYEGNGELRGHYAAMLAVIQNVDGSHQSLQRTYFDPRLPIRKKTMPAVSKFKGAAVRLMEHNGEVALAEGIETALAVHEMWDMPAWAVCGAWMMSQFLPPDGLKRIHIAADNDAAFHGQAAAYTTAKRLSDAGYKVTVSVPEDAQTDWLDQWTFTKEGL